MSYKLLSNRIDEDTAKKKSTVRRMAENEKGVKSKAQCLIAYAQKPLMKTLRRKKNQSFSNMPVSVKNQVELRYRKPKNRFYFDVMEKDEEEEFYPDEGLPDIDEEFEGCYTIIKDDFSQFNLFNVTIKGDAKEEGINLCRYTVVYTDGSVKRIAWQPNDLIWTELGAGHTAHSVSIGAIIENQFGSNALPRTDFGVFKPTGFNATHPFNAWYAIDGIFFDISVVSSEDPDGEGLYLVYYLNEKRNNDHADRIIFFNPDIFGWDEKNNEPSLHTWLIGDIITGAYV